MTHSFAAAVANAAIIRNNFVRKLNPIHILLVDHIAQQAHRVVDVRLLHLIRRYVLAIAQLENVLLAVENDQPANIVKHPDISRSEEFFVVKRKFCLLGIHVVLLEHPAAVNAHFATCKRLVCRQVPHFRNVNEFDHRIRQGRADTAVAEIAPKRHRARRRRFGAPIPLHDLPAETAPYEI
ncbi:hypothetical protein AYI70_g2831 [Smittium culicis]|uniref:Uncharacterized protein n=1 Tax=Smittium culicis TaxID=133412 RepID=A0A1R1Y6C9_9FUNG|nr:hypothetical protein AYI70_g2831 [Smittium culicis]